MDGNEKKLLLFASISHSLCHGYMLILPAVLLLVADEFGTGLFQIGMLGNVSYLAFGIGALPAGYFADRFGSRRVVSLFLFGAAITAIVLSRSPDLPFLFGGFFLLGIFCSLYHPSGLSLVSTIGDRGEALALHGVWGNLSIAFTPVVYAFIATLYGWRGAYVISGVIGLLVAMAALSIPFRAEKRENRKERGPLAEPGCGRQLALLYLVVMLNGFVYRGVLTFMPAWINQANGADLVQAGAVTSAALLLGIGGQLFGGRMYKRFNREILLFALLVAVIPFLWGTGHLSWPLLAFAAGVFFFFHFASQPVVNGLVAQYTRSGRRSMGYGFSFFLSFGAGSFSASAAGYVADHFGMPHLFTFLCGFAALLAIVSGILIVNSRPAQTGETGELKGGSNGKESAE